MGFAIKQDMLIHRLAIYVCIMSFFYANIAYAATNSTNLSVSVSVPPQANITGGQIHFGTSSNPSLTQNASGIFQVNVSTGYAYHITLDAGLHATSTRRLSSSTGHFRPYSLYQDAAHSIQWGDALFANTYPAGQAVANTGTGATQTFTVYASLPGQPRIAVPTGSYTDAVTITVHY
ncbi:spore coat U domain-containing protein [Mariprofundus ferrooxydans]|nr:spore coat U domain-containing protein [Mariprofundus ferrooxydans]